MGLIGGRKKSKTVVEQALGYVGMVLKALAAQRMARSAYKGYKWMRRLPFVVGGAAVVAFVVRKTQQKSGGASDAGYTPPAESGSTVPASTPSTPTPTGSPTAVTPAPTAAADGAPERGSGGDGEAAGGNDEPKT